MVLIRFNSERDKRAIMQKCSVLKDSGITFSDDLPLEERKKRQVVVAAHKEAKRIGLNAKISRNGLLIGADIVGHEALAKPGWAEKFVTSAETDGESVRGGTDSEANNDESASAGFAGAGRAPRNKRPRKKSPLTIPPPLLSKNGKRLKPNTRSSSLDRQHMQT
jgi:hypothetical protein